MNIETLFEEALARPAPERACFLAEACQSRSDLRAELEALLAAYDKPEHVLDKSPLAQMLQIDPLFALAAPGERIAVRYSLIEPIGEGGMGTVWMAEQSEPVRRMVALKLIKPGMDSKQVLARFEAERQALAMMDHPNIARVFDGGTTDQGRPFFVMELVRGIPITEYCDRERLTVDERLNLFTDVCRAVQHAHQKGIIHRDLKPTNILVTVIDGAPVPKVIDFGVAKAIGDALTDRTLHTGFHQFVGTPLYMSPEQADLAGTDVDTRSDIYSLGVLLYELLTGTTPFDSQTLKQAAFDEMRRMIREDEPPKPSLRLSSLGDTQTSVAAQRQADPKRLGSSLEGELDWIVMKALEKDRRRRYETASDFASDVVRYLTDQPVEACPPSRRYRFTKYARRNRAAIATGALVLLTLTVGAAVSVWQAARAIRASHLAEVRYEQARQAVDVMYTQVAEKWLAQQPKLTTVQTEFLEKALAFYESFAGELDDDPVKQFEAARARYRVGKIRRALGKFDQAAVAFRQSSEQFQGLADRFPMNEEYRSELAFLSVDLGGLEIQLGRLNEAEPHLKLAVHTLETLVARNSNDRKNTGRLARSLAALGSLHERRGRNQEAEPLLRRGLDLFERLEAKGPLDPEIRDQFPICEGDLGLVYMNTSRLAEAEQQFRSAAKRLDTWLKEDPANPRFRGSLAIVLSNLATIQYDSGRRDEARESDVRAIALVEALSKDFPELLVYRGMLMGFRKNSFLSLDEDKRTDEAELVVRRAVDEGNILVNEYPDVPEYREALATFLSLAADFYSVSPQASFHDPERAVELARRAVELRPATDGLAWQSLGWALYRTGDWKGCIESLEKSQKYARSGNYFAAMAYWHLGDKAKAREQFERFDTWLTGYEKRWNPSVYPKPALLREVRAEAAALLKVPESQGEIPPKPPD